MISNSQEHQANSGKSSPLETGKEVANLSNKKQTSKLKSPHVNKNETGKLMNDRSEQTANSTIEVGNLSKIKQIS